MSRNPSHPSRPSPRVRLLLRPPLTFSEFGELLKAIAQRMDDLNIDHAAGSDYEVANEGETVTLRDPTGLTVETFDLQAFRT